MTPKPFDPVNAPICLIFNHLATLNVLPLLLHAIEPVDPHPLAALHRLSSQIHCQLGGAGRIAQNQSVRD